MSGNTEIPFKQETKKEFGLRTIDADFFRWIKKDGLQAEKIVLIYASTSTVTPTKDTPTLVRVTGIYYFKGGYDNDIKRAEERDY